MKPWLAVAMMVLGPSAWAAGALGSQYQSVGDCGKFPLADITVAKGMCVGIAAGPDQGLKMPRTILEVEPGEFILTDMGGWVGPNGRVLRLRVAEKGPATVSQIYRGLYQPHGLARGPEGKIYVGEKGRISRFDPRAPGSAMELVLAGFPEDGLHPLTNLIFLKDGALVVNIGAPTDRCETKAKPLAPQNPCPLSQGERPRAALWKLSFDKPGGKVIKTEVFARGLRNSMALALDPQTGALIQGENGVDLPGENEPVEELNVIKPGAHYGWPWCSGKATPLPGSGVTEAACKQYEPAAMDLPPHSAPLGMIVYDRGMFPALKGKLIVALHGYRAFGHRIVAIDPRALAGGAKPKLEEIVSGWSRKRGVRPLGGPVGMTVASDGAIWFVEDKNRTVMVLRASSATETKAAQQTVETPVVPPPKGWDVFVKEIVKTKCTACHVEARANAPAEIWSKMAEAGWVGEGALNDSKLARALKGTGPEKPMPPPAGFKSDPKSRAAVGKLLADNP